MLSSLSMSRQAPPCAGPQRAPRLAPHRASCEGPPPAP
jgi:hypothetical protein